MIVVPELILKSIVEGLLTSLSNDIKNSKKEDSFLFRLFGDLSSGAFKYYDQAVNIFLKSNGRPRQLKVKIGYDGDVSQPPLIYILTPRDTYNFEGIGVQMEEHYNANDKVSSPINICRFSAESSVVIVSDQIEEILLVYRAMQSLLIAGMDTISLSGLQNCKIGGADITLEQDLIPKQVFMRVLSLSFEYEIDVPSMSVTMDDVTKIVPKGTPKN